jgi:hypothetical protein
LSAAASHAKDKKKGSDPLEEYCKDNPETDECRTYEDWNGFYLVHLFLISKL